MDIARAFGTNSHMIHGLLRAWPEPLRLLMYGTSVLRTERTLASRKCDHASLEGISPCPICFHFNYCSQIMLNRMSPNWHVRFSSI